MSSVGKNHKRIAAYWELSKAVKDLRKLGDPLVTLGQAIEALGQVVKSLRYMGEATKPTTHEWTDEKGRHVKVSRDGLPQRVRTRAGKLATMVEALAAEVKALPVTPEQKLLAKGTRAKAREKAKGRVASEAR